MSSGKTHRCAKTKKYSFGVSKLGFQIDEQKKKAVKTSRIDKNKGIHPLKIYDLKRIRKKTETKCKLHKIYIQNLWVLHDFC